MMLLLLLYSFFAAAFTLNLADHCVSVQIAAAAAAAADDGDVAACSLPIAVILYHLHHRSFRLWRRCTVSLDGSVGVLEKCCHRPDDIVHSSFDDGTTSLFARNQPKSNGKKWTAI